MFIPTIVQAGAPTAQVTIFCEGIIAQDDYVTESGDQIWLYQWFDAWNSKYYDSLYRGGRAKDLGLPLIDSIGYENINRKFGVSQFASWSKTRNNNELLHDDIQQSMGVMNSSQADEVESICGLDVQRSNINSKIRKWLRQMARDHRASHFLIVPYSDENMEAIKDGYDGFYRLDSEQEDYSCKKPQISKVGAWITVAGPKDKFSCRVKSFFEWVGRLWVKK